MYFFNFLYFLRAMSVYTNGKHLFFTVWNGRVGVETYTGNFIVTKCISK